MTKYEYRGYILELSLVGEASSIRIEGKVSKYPKITFYNEDIFRLKRQFEAFVNEMFMPETLVVLEEIKECPWSNTKEYNWYTKHPIIERVGFTYDADSVFEGHYIKSYSEIYGKESGYIPFPVLEKVNCIYKEK